MLGAALALIAIGLIVLFLSPIIGIAIGAVGLIFLIGLLIARGRRAAADSGGP
jgi:hypothetical protein